MMVPSAKSTYDFFYSSLSKMAPNISMPTGVLHECDDEISANVIPPEVVKPSERKLELVWRNIILFAYLHLVGLYGIYLMFTSAKLYTSIFGEYL